MAALDAFHSSKKGNEIELALNSVFDAISMRYSALTLFCGGAAETFDRPYKGRKKKNYDRVRQEFVARRYRNTSVTYPGQVFDRTFVR